MERRPVPVARESAWDTLIHRWRAIRRGFKSRLPYVRRREYRILAERREQALDALAKRPPLATEAPIVCLHQRPAASRELCVFVSFAPTPSLKAHVAHHLRAFQAQGLDTVLVINSEHAAETFKLDPALVASCRAVFVRANRGFDFAAWAHALQQVGGSHGLDRVVFSNDSIVGPVSDADFAAIIGRVRSSACDIVGLTEAQLPLPHIQSFFLVFQHRAIQDGFLDQLMARIQNLPTKDLVIDVYETRLTRQFTEQGLRCEALFPNLGSDVHSSNDTHFRWRGLLAAGFPYVKVSVISQQRGTSALREAIPADMLNAWEAEQTQGARP